MEELGKVIRNTLKAKNMSSSDLAKMIGLNPRTIDNVIHGKSKKVSLIHKISAALGINLLFYLQNKNLKIDVRDIELNVDKYKQASEIILALLKTNRLLCSKEQLNILINTLYDFICEENHLTEDFFTAFARGMLHYGIKNFLLINKKDALEVAKEKNNN